MLGLPFSFISIHPNYGRTADTARHRQGCFISPAEARLAGTAAVRPRTLRSTGVSLPYQIAAEQKAEDEDEDRGSEHHDVDVEGEVLESYIRHPETVVPEIRGHGYPGGGTEEKKEGIREDFMLASTVRREYCTLGLLCFLPL